MALKDEVIIFMSRNPEKEYTTTEIVESLNLLGRGRGSAILNQLVKEKRVKRIGFIRNRNDQKVFTWKVIINENLT